MKKINKSAIYIKLQVLHIYVYTLYPKYLQSVNKFLAVVEEELQLKTVRLICGQNFKFKGAGIFRKMMEPKFPGNMHISIHCVLNIYQVFEGVALIKKNGLADWSKSFYPLQISCVGYNNV